MSLDIPPAIVEEASYVVLRSTRWVPHNLASLNYDDEGRFPCVQVYVFTDENERELFVIETGAEKNLTKEELKEINT